MGTCHARVCRERPAGALLPVRVPRMGELVAALLCLDVAIV